MLCDSPSDSSANPAASLYILSRLDVAMFILLHSFPRPLEPFLPRVPCTCTLILIVSDVHLKRMHYLLLCCCPLLRCCPLSSKNILGGEFIPYQYQRGNQGVRCRLFFLFRGSEYITKGYPYLHDASANKNVHVSNASRTTHPETHFETQNTPQNTAQTPQHKGSTRHVSASMTMAPVVTWTCV